MTEEKMHEILELQKDGLLDREKARSWPSHLEKITGIPVVNASKNSQSATTIAIQTIEAMYKEHKGKNVLYLIGSSSPTGIWWPGAERGHDTILLHPLRKHPNPFEKVVAEQFNEHTSWQQMHHLYEISYRGLKSFLEQKKKSVYFVYTNVGLPPDLPGTPPYIKDNLIDQIGPDVDPTKDEVLLACGHYPEKYHIELAQRIADKIESGEI